MTRKANPALKVISGDTAKSPAAAAVPADDALALAPTPKKSSGRDVAKVMLYLPPKVARKFKEIAFTEDRKAHDVYLEAIDTYLVAQGHGGIKGVTGR
ncbi:hypothetical protein FHR71_005591 [Methylobacterium sp. RAS18]|nr:hypothetical protein [Methylobacterium sp. RAS18]